VIGVVSGLLEVAGTELLINGTRAKRYLQEVKEYFSASDCMMTSINISKPKGSLRRSRVGKNTVTSQVPVELLARYGNHRYLGRLGWILRPCPTDNLPCVQ